MSQRSILAHVVVVAVGLLSGCAEEDAAIPPDAAAAADAEPVATALETIGTWESNFGGLETISASSWGSAAVVSYDNDENYVVTQNPDDDAFNPSKFNKLVWTEIADKSFYYCWVDYGLDTAEAAEATTKTADDADPGNSGCGDFAWTRLFEPLEIRGRWATNFGGTDELSGIAWNGATVIDFQNDDNWAVTQTAADDLYNPSKFNKIVWTELADESFYYCWVDFGLDTAEEAANSPKTADDTDPGNGGCGDFAWTKNVPAVEIHGSWTSSFGGTEVITSFTWGAPKVIKYSNEDNVAVTQNPADAQYSPDKFNKIVWTEITDGAFYYCTVAFGQDTALDAENSTKSADASDPDNGGCGGTFPWTKLSAE